MREIGLFPLHMVLLPRERLPLHIFEERYKELIGESLEEKIPFGFIMVDEPAMREVGTLAEVDHVEERFPDGRLNIVVLGLTRFRVVELTTGRSFHTATIEDVVDEPDAAATVETDALLAALSELAKVAEAEEPAPTQDEPELTFRLAAAVELENEVRQDLLELTSERERTLRLTSVFSELTRGVRRQKRARERAETNGRVEPHD